MQLQQPFILFSKVFPIFWHTYTKKSRSFFHRHTPHTHTYVHITTSMIKKHTMVEGQVEVYSRNTKGEFLFCLKTTICTHKI